MKILCVGDLHGKKCNLDKIETVLKKIKEIEKYVDLIVFLGDLNDTKSIIRSEIQNLYFKYFKQFNKKKYYAIVGNHDYENSIECKNHSLLVFKDLINIVDSPLTFQAEISPTGPDKSMLMMPYYHDLDKFRGIIEKSKENYLFMHQGVDGCSYSNGQIEESSLKKHHFKNFEWVIAGHIHKPQIFENINYIGTPFTQNFGEYKENKYIAILDTKNNRFEYINLDIPKHKVIEREIKDLKEIKSIKKDINDKDIIQLRISCPESLSSKIKISLFKDWNINSLKVNIIKENKDVLIKSTLSKEKMMEIYINNLNTNLDKKELIELNKKIMGDL